MKSKRNPQTKKGENIKVYVRCRPANSSDKRKPGGLCVNVDVDQQHKGIVLFKKRSNKLKFDGTFGQNTTQAEIYEAVAQPLVTAVLKGYSCTVFAFGQTGTGKTFTMEGHAAQNSDPGLKQRALQHLLSESSKRSDQTIIEVSFFDFYDEEATDLLHNGETVEIGEDPIAKKLMTVRGLVHVPVETEEDIHNLMVRGNQTRQKLSSRRHATGTNASTSTSHTIFTITVTSRGTSDVKGTATVAKLSFVDLAGSENIRADAVPEESNVNRGLQTFGKVVDSLATSPRNVPFENSKLTQLLRDSLGGATKTAIIGTISPAQADEKETLSTIDFIHRAQSIKNHPKPNEKLSKVKLDKLMGDKAAYSKEDAAVPGENQDVSDAETHSSDSETGASALTDGTADAEFVIEQIRKKTRSQRKIQTQNSLNLTELLEMKDSHTWTGLEHRDEAAELVQKFRSLADKTVKGFRKEYHTVQSIAVLANTLSEHYNSSEQRLKKAIDAVNDLSAILSGGLGQPSPDVGSSSGSASSAQEKRKFGGKHDPPHPKKAFTEADGFSKTLTKVLNKATEYFAARYEHEEFLKQERSE